MAERGREQAGAGAGGVPGLGRFEHSAPARWRLWGALVALFFVLLFLVQAIAPPPGPDSSEAASHNSLSYTPRGFRALYTVLERLGQPVQRFSLSYAALPPAGESVLLVLDPNDASRFSRGENIPLESGHAERLRRWVEAGGRVVCTLPGRTLFSLGGWELTTGESDAALKELGKALGIDDLSRAASFREVLPDLPPAEARGEGGALRGHGPIGGFERHLDELDSRARQALRPYLSSGKDEDWPLFKETEDYAPLLTLENGALALERRAGDGLAIAFSTALPFANAGLRLTPAAEAILELLDYASEGGRRTIFFDEYTHGIFRRGGFLRWARETALFYPLATLLLAMALLAWHGALRFGPPTPCREVPRRAKEEFVLNLGGLYRSGGHRAHVLNVVARGYESRLTALLGEHGGSATSGATAAEAAGAERFAVAGEPAGEKELFREAQRLHGEYTRALESLRGKKPTHG